MLVYTHTHVCMFGLYNFAFKDWHSCSICEEFSEDKHTHVKEGSGCDQKNEEVPEEVTQTEEPHVTETLRDISPHWKLVQT